MKTLNEIVTIGENEECAWYENSNDNENIAKTMIALSNTKGGSIFFGLKNNGKIIGVNPFDEIENVKQISHVFCDREVDFSTHIHQEGVRLVLELIISTLNHPISFKNKTGGKEMYVRVGENNIRANKILKAVLKDRDIISDLSFELTIEEKELLELIARNPLVSLSKIYKISNQKLSQIDQQLVRLIRWKLIKMDVTDDSSQFSIV